jgi:hypothetical protein
MKRLLVSIVIATLLTAALLACLNGVGVPVVRATAAAPDAHTGGITLTHCESTSNNESDDVLWDAGDMSGSASWSAFSGDWSKVNARCYYEASGVYSMTLVVSGDPPYDDWSGATAGMLIMEDGVALDCEILDDQGLERRCTGRWGETIDGFALGNNEFRHPNGSPAHTYQWDWDLFVNADPTPPPTGCVPIEDVILHGPATATVGTPVWFESELTPVSPTRPISWSFDVTYGPDGQQVKTVSGRSSGRVQATWYNTGTKTITVTASNCEGYGYATDSTTITLDHKYQWTPPFSVTVPGKPILDCTHCPAPEWGFWQIGHWIDWLWCNLKCWFEYFLEFLYWLWKMLYATLSSMINAFMEQFWIGVNNLLLMIDYHGERIAVNVEAFFEEIAEFARAIVFWYRDNIWDPFWTAIADWIDENGDAFGDFLQMVVYDFRDWLTGWLDVLALFFDGAGSFFDFLSMATSEISDWSWDVLTELGDYFNSWGTGLGDFLAMAVYDIRDWLDTGVFPRWVDFFDAWADWFHMLARNTRRVRNWIFDTLTDFGATLNETVDNTTAFIADAVRDFRDWGHDLLTWYGNFVYGNIVAIGEFLANSVRRLAKLLEILVLTWANVVSALAIFALAILDVIDLVIEKAVDGLGILIYVSGLTGDLVTGLRDAINSSSTADIYQDVPGLYYFWRGMTFFEDTVGSSPLAVLNLVAIGIIGINLSLWTVGQVGDLMEDVARF